MKARSSLRGRPPCFVEPSSDDFHGEAGACVGRLRERGTKRKTRCFYEGVGYHSHPSWAPESSARLPHSEFPRPVVHACELLRACTGHSVGQSFAEGHGQT